MESVHYYYHRLGGGSQRAQHVQSLSRVTQALRKKSLLGNDEIERAVENLFYIGAVSLPILMRVPRLRKITSHFLQCTTIKIIN